jgi:hypothetical protein
MNKHPILFNGEMVEAILAGRKTQTRRVVKPQPSSSSKWIGWIISTGWHDKNAGCAQWADDTFPFSAIIHKVRCPYGLLGDQLWVREAWRPLDEDMPVGLLMQGDEIYYRADYVGDALDGKWRPSIHMPRWASRITLEIVNIRVARVQEISEAEAGSEGVPALHIIYNNGPSYRDTFKELWNSINAKRGFSWDVNPWVWVIEFKRI